MSKFIFLCQVFEPDTISTSQLFSPIIRRMSKDQPIVVYCGFPSQGITELRKIPRTEIQDKLTIRRLGLRVAYKKNKTAHLLGHLSFVLHAFVVLCFQSKKTIITATTNPPFNLHILYFSSLLRRFKYRIIFLDIYPEGLVATGTLNAKGLIHKIWSLMNRLCIVRAQQTATIGRDMVTLLAKNYGLDPQSIIYFPHWSASEPESPIPFSQNSLTTKWQLQNKFVVQYSGNMGLWHDMNSLVDAAIKIKNKFPHFGIHFMFIGDGRARNDAWKRAENASNITFMNYLPQKDLPLSLTACHVSLISMKSGLCGVAVPCKIYGIMASARAILALVPEDSEIALTIREHKIGYVIKPGDVDSMIKMLMKMMSNPKETMEMGQRAFKAYHRHYNQNTAQINLTHFMLDEKTGDEP